MFSIMAFLSYTASLGGPGSLLAKLRNALLRYDHKIVNFMLKSRNHMICISNESSRREKLFEGIFDFR